MGSHSLRGVFPPIATPMLDDESVDEPGLRALVNFLIEHRVDGLYVLGSSSEFAYLDAGERRKVVKIVHEQTNGRVPLILCVSATSDREAVAMVHYAKDLGIDAFATLLPEFFPLGAREVRSYFEILKMKCGESPLLAYQFHDFVPATANLTPKIVTSLANTGIIQGLKDSTLDWGGHANPVIETLEHRDQFTFFSGTEHLWLQSLDAGVPLDGLICSGTNHFPRLYVDLLQATRDSDEELLETIRPLFNEIMALYGAAGVLQLPALIKELLKAVGLPVKPIVRNPLPPLKKIHRKKILVLLAKIDQAGYLDRF